MMMMETLQKLHYDPPPNFSLRQLPFLPSFFPYITTFSSLFDLPLFSSLLSLSINFSLSSPVLVSLFILINSYFLINLSYGYLINVSQKLLFSHFFHGSFLIPSLLITTTQNVQKSFQTCVFFLATFIAEFSSPTREFFIA